MRDHELVANLDRVFDGMLSNHHGSMNCAYITLNGHKVCLYRFVKPTCCEFELRYKDEELKFYIKKGMLFATPLRTKNRLTQYLESLDRARSLVCLG